MKTLTISILLSAVLIGSAMAQADEQEAIRKFITNYNQELSMLHKTKNKENIFKYVSDNFSFTYVGHSLDGNVVMAHGDVNDFRSYLDLIINELQVTYTISKIYNIHIREKIAVITYDVEFKTEKEGGVISNGYESQVCIIKETGAGWKLINAQKASLEESIEKGICLGEMFKGHGYDYIAKVKVPSGTHFSMEMEEFKFEKKDNGERIIEVDSKTYLWDANNDLWKLQGSKKENKIGFGISENQVVSHILLKDMYNEHCSEIQMRK